MDSLRVVVDQVAMTEFVGKGLAELLDHPASCRALRDIGVQNSSSPVVDSEADIKEPELDRRDHEEIHTGDQIAVFSKEGGPALLLVRVGLGFRQVT
jgi:hypothetical protein